MPPVVFLMSNTGNTRTFIEFLRKHSEQDIEICEDFSSSLLSSTNQISLGTFTWSNGKIPKKMKNFLIENQREFKNKDVFIFGSGLSIYPKFCAAVDSVEKIVNDCEANVKGKFKFEQRFNEEDFSKDEIDQLINQIKQWSRKI